MNAVLDEHARLFAQFMLFYLSLWPIRVLSTAVHEAAHAVAALVTNQKLVAWGVGFEQVKLRVHLGEAIFYIARPMVGGMTLAVPRTHEMPRLANLFFIGSGMLADLMQVVASVAAWSAGWTNGLVVAWMAVSIFAFVGGLVPGTFQTGSMVLENDARLLVNAVSGRSRSRQHRLGLQLRGVRGLIGLIERIGHPGLAAYYHLHAAVHEAALENVEGARRDLEQGSVPEVAELPLARELLALAGLAVAVAADADDTPRIAETVAASFPANDNIQLSVAWYLAAWRFERGLPIDGQAEVVNRLALASGDRDQRASAQVFALSVDADRDPEERYREIVAAHPNVPGIHRIDMLTVGAKRLANLGQLERARRMCQEANVEIAREAEFIDSPETRAAFTDRARARLQAILPDEPLAAAEVPVAKPPRVRVPISLPAATFVSGAVTSLIAAGACTWDAIRPFEPAVAGDCAAVVGGCFLIAALATLTALARGQWRSKAVLAGCLLAVIGVALAVQQLSIGPRAARPVAAQAGRN